MLTFARTGTALLGFVLATALVVTGPGTPDAVASVGSPDWLPVQSSVPSSSLSVNQVAALQSQMTGGKSDGLDWHLRMQSAAAAGAYVPGVSDYARANGVSPMAVSQAQATSAYGGYASYQQKPGANSIIAGSANRAGVVTITSLPGKTSALTKAGQAMGAAGRGVTGASTVIGLFSVGYAVGGGAAKLMGLPTSGNPVCDLLTAVASSECGLGAVEGYVPNSDVTATPPGWALPNKNTILMNPGGRWFSGSVSSYPHDVLATQAVLGAPTFGSKTGSVIVSTVLTGSCSTSAIGPVIDTVIAKGKQTNGTIGNMAIGYLRDVRPNCGAQTGQVTIPMPASTTMVFDHIELYSSGNPALELRMNRWYPEGHALWTPGQDADPLRWWKTSWTCTSGQTGSVESAQFRETDASWPVPADPSCLTGEVSEIVITQETAGGGSEVVYEWRLPPETATLLSQFPGCANGSCVLDLVTTVAGPEVSCFASPELCTNWLTSPTRDTDFQCRYAGQDVAISECYLYGPTFSKAAVAAGSPYGDPKTGQPLTPTTPSGDPIPTPGTGTGTGPSQDPNCPPGFSWGGLFNPWWYYKGVSCALQEAFVPNPVTTQNMISSVNTTLSGRSPFNLLYALPPVIKSFTTGWGGGCAGMPNFSGIDGVQLRVPCSPPDSAQWRAAYGLMVVALWTGTAITSWLMISRSIGSKS